MPRNRCSRRRRTFRFHPSTGSDTSNLSPSLALATRRRDAAERRQCRVVDRQRRAGRQRGRDKCAGPTRSAFLIFAFGSATAFSASHAAGSLCVGLLRLLGGSGLRRDACVTVG